MAASGSQLIWRVRKRDIGEDDGSAFRSEAIARKSWRGQVLLRYTTCLNGVALRALGLQEFRALLGATSWHLVFKLGDDHSSNVRVSTQEPPKKFSSKMDWGSAQLNNIRTNRMTTCRWRVKKKEKRNICSVIFNRFQQLTPKKNNRFHKRMPETL